MYIPSPKYLIKMATNVYEYRLNPKEYKMVRFFPLGLSAFFLLIKLQNKQGNKSVLKNTIPYITQPKTGFDIKSLLKKKNVTKIGKNNG